MNEHRLLPACCTVPQASWPLPEALPNTLLLSTRFDSKQLAADDFQRSGIEAPANIQRSVAKRQAEFLAGRLCARNALCSILEVMMCLPLEP